MSEALHSKNYIADGAVTGKRFVKKGSAAGDVSPATGAADKVIGIAVYAAVDNAAVEVDLVGVTQLTLGASAVAGDLLMPASGGTGIPVTLSAGERSGALALEDGVADDEVFVVVSPVVV